MIDVEVISDPQAVTERVSRYHSAAAPGGRAHRLVVISHPLPVSTHAKD
jgi:hypothetical protein